MSAAADFFASFCLVQEGEICDDIGALRILASSCATRLEYWEIIYVASGSARQAISAATDSPILAKNLRVLLVSDDASYYRRRLIAAAEAIGDVVTLTSLNELQVLDPISFAKEAAARDRITIAHRVGSGREFT